jgi:hypothetical protein
VQDIGAQWNKERCRLALVQESLRRENALGIKMVSFLSGKGIITWKEKTRRNPMELELCLNS